MLLSDANKKLFLQTHPEYIDEEKYKVFLERITYLYDKTKEIINYIKTNGFKNNYKELDEIKWVSFITKTMIYIEKIKGLTNGEEKLELLLSYISVIIINLIPISNDIKIIIINKLHNLVPDVVENLIFISKKLHTFSFNILKKIKNKLKKYFSCFYN